MEMLEKFLSMLITVVSMKLMLLTECFLHENCWD